jgi:hypothetical protein
MSVPEGQDIQGKTYPGFGRCIYCGSDGELTQEHIIPFALHGNTVIKDACCDKCRIKIDPIDRHLGRSIFGQYRIHAGLQTRNPKDRPSALPAKFIIGSQVVNRDLPIADHPYSLAMPIWGEAGFFRGAPIDAPFPQMYLNIYHYLPENIRNTLALTESEDFQVWSEGRADLELFARGIAKIAYCHAVVELGLGNFRPLLLPRIILGESGATPFFVGSPLRTPEPPLDRKVLHFVQRSEIASRTSAFKIYIMSVRLFAASAHEDHGMPTYTVIVGAPPL